MSLRYLFSPTGKKMFGSKEYSEHKRIKKIDPGQNL